MPNQLTQLEAQILQDLEQIIDDALPTFFEMGRAMLQIKEKRLYRADYVNWEDYCEKRWGFSVQHASRLMRGHSNRRLLEGSVKTEPAGSVLDETTSYRETVPRFTKEQLPTNERSIRGLSKVPQRDRVKAYAKAVKLADGHRPTSQHVSDAVVLYEKPKRPADAPAREDQHKPAFTSEFDQAMELLAHAHAYFCLLNTSSTNEELQKEIQCARMRRALDTIKFYSPTYSLFELPEWVPRDKWDQFVIMRGKKSITAHAFGLLMKALSKLRRDGYDPGEIIDNSILKNWSSFYEPPKQKENGLPTDRRSAQERSNQLTAAEVNAFTDGAKRILQEGRPLLNFSGGGLPDS